MGKGSHERVNTKGWESLRTILKLSHHSKEWILGKSKVLSRRSVIQARNEGSQRRMVVVEVDRGNQE